MSDIMRRADGTLVRGGSSLNPAGRRGRRRLVTPSDFRKAIIAAGKRKVSIGSETMTLFGFHLRNLSSGNPKTRLGSNDFIGFVQRAAALEEQLPDRCSGAPSVPASRSSCVGRDPATGHFVGGVSGNPRGRPRSRPAPLPLQQYLEIIAEANRQVDVTWQERPERVTAFEAQLLKIGTASGSARIAARKYIELVLNAAAMAMWRQRKEDERTRAETDRYWQTMANGTAEEKQAMFAAHPEIPPAETMPDEILGENLANALEERSRAGAGGPLHSARRPAPVPGKWLDQEKG